MAKKPSPNAKVNFPSDGPAYVSWAGNKAQQAAGLKIYTSAIQEAATASQGSRTRNFSDLTTTLSGKPGLRNSDYDYFRPDQTVPETHKEIIAFARKAYRRIGLIRNAIDLMGDFACQGISIVHPNKRIEKFYKRWFQKIGGKERSERFLNNLYRTGNVILYRSFAKITPELNKFMKALANDIKVEVPSIDKNVIPWRYNFFNCVL